MSDLISELTDQLDEDSGGCGSRRTDTPGRNKVERDWRSEEEPPEQEQDPQDDQDQDQQDGDSEDQDGQQQDGSGQQGDQSEGDQSEDEQSEGGDSEGDQSEGDQTSGDQPEADGEGEGDSDGESSDGEADADGSQDGNADGGDDAQGQDGGESGNAETNESQQGDSSEGSQQGEADASSGGGTHGDTDQSAAGDRVSDEMAEQIRDNRSISSTEDSSGEDASGEEGKSDAQKEREEKARALNDDAFGGSDEESNWKKSQREKKSSGRVTTGRNEDDGKEYFTEGYGKSRAERIEDKIQNFAYEINNRDVGTDWTPQKIKDHKIATMFALMVAKVAEDMSYTEIDGDRYWDTHEIMKRQVTKRPLHKCKKDYEKSRLALLVDTSPSCRQEAMFYSKIASGAMLRDDIDIFLCPNGRIDAKFDRDAMRFLTDKRQEDWQLDGRVVLYFTDWDGTSQIIENSKNAKIYWFDNTDDMWDEDEPHSRKVRYQFQGEHYHIPDAETFKRAARKIRP